MSMMDSDEYNRRLKELNDRLEADDNRKSTSTSVASGRSMKRTSD
jgi:hypothetical protein